MRKKWKRFLRPIITIGCLALLIWGIYGENYKEILRSIQSISGEWFLFLLLIGVLYFLIEAVGAFLLIKSESGIFTFGDAVEFVALGLFTKTVSSGMGVLPVKSYYLYRKGIDTGIGIATLEHFFYKVAILIWTMILFPAAVSEIIRKETSILGWIGLGFLITFGLTAALFFICVCKKFRKFTFWLLKKLPLGGSWQGKKEKWRNQLESVYRKSESLLKSKYLIIQMIFINMIKLIVLYSIPWFCLEGTGAGAECGYFVSFLLAAYMILLSNSLPHVAGIGPTEFAFLYLYGIYLPVAEAGTAMILYRISSYFFPFILSMIIFARIRCKMWGDRNVVYEKKNK